MNKRTFIKLSSALLAAPLMSPLRDFAQQNEQLTNWAGNLTYSTDKIYYPKSVEEVQQFVRKLDKVKVLGTRHCFNTIADSKYNFISLKKMNQGVWMENEHSVTLAGGVRYGDLCPLLNDIGYALHNLASLPHISVAGAITTATHGSGVKNGNLSSAVVALEVVTADGSVINLSKEKDGEKFHAAVVGLGAIGVITRVTLNVVPTFMMRQQVYLKLPLSELKEHFDEIISAAYSVSLFTDWQNENINEVWLKSKVDDVANSKVKEDFFGAKPATKNVHPIIELSAENCTEQMGVPGAWYERLPHFKMGFTPSSGKELQAEYFVPHQHALDAFLAIQRMGKEIGPHLFISEIRTIAADDLWMSPCYKQPSVTIHFTWKQEWDAVMKLLPVIEKELAPYHAKPHWGKLFTMPPSKLTSLYEKMPEFKKMINEYDPKKKFRNEFLEKNIFRAS